MMMMVDDTMIQGYMIQGDDGGGADDGYRK
jgi:hypothetical protein